MDSRQSSAIRIGRYRLFDEIAAGGMATVHLGRLAGAAGFSRTVAVKRLHSSYAKDPAFVAMFTDEARIASRVRHPNVVPTLDVVASDGELFLVMEYVDGESLARLVSGSAQRGEGIPVEVAAGVLVAALHGLHAAHDATDEAGQPLGIVHRDVSPHNILVGTDGVARVVDFGIAKAAGRIQNTSEGQVKGKVAYMSPEQVRGETLDRRSDVFAAGVVFWELLTGERLFAASNATVSILRILDGHVEPPSRRVAGLAPELDAIALRALHSDRAQRFETALAMAAAIEHAVVPATQSRIADWVQTVGGEAIEQRLALVARIEREAASLQADTSTSVTAIVPQGAVERPRRRWVIPVIGVVAATSIAALIARRAVRAPAAIASEPDEYSAAAAPIADASSAIAPASAVVDPREPPPPLGSVAPDSSASAPPDRPRAQRGPRGAASAAHAVATSARATATSADASPAASSDCPWVFTVKDGIKIPVRRQCP